MASPSALSEVASSPVGSAYSSPPEPPDIDVALSSPAYVDVAALQVRVAVTLSFCLRCEAACTIFDVHIMHRDLICSAPFWHAVAPPATVRLLGSF